MIKEISIIGGGVMGSQLALYFNSYGLNVNIIHKSINSKFKSEQRINKLSESISWKRQIKNDVTIKHFLELGETINSELIIECIDEDFDSKVKLFSELLKHLDGNQIIATNSSTIPIDLIIPNDYSGNYYNLHFFNPILSTKTVEITTSNQNHNQHELVDILESLNFNVIEVKNEVGFLINKISFPFWISSVNEFERLNINSDKFDMTLKKALAYNCGPLEVVDIIGLKTFDRISSILYGYKKNEIYKTPILIKRMIEKGYLGKEIGIGFYLWDNDRKNDSNNLDCLKQDNESCLAEK